MPGLLARGRRRADLHQADAGSAGRDRRCLWSLGALPETLVWDRQAGLHGHGGRPSDEFAAFCGQLRVDWLFCEPADPQAKGVVERLQDFVERTFEPGVDSLIRREILLRAPRTLRADAGGGRPARRAAPAEALEDALKGLEPEEITGPGGLLTQLAGRVIETALGAELTDHLGHPPGGVPDSANVRNGSTAKTVQTDLGPVEVNTPRDRDGYV